MTTSRPDDRIFVSYRAEDLPDARSVADVLRSVFDDHRVFLAVRDIKGGRDFTREIGAQLEHCSVVVAVIGKEWHRRVAELADKRDWVRLELVTALNDPRKLVIPVLVGVPLPDRENLPEELQPLRLRHAVVLRHEDWDATVPKLVRAITSFGFLRLEARQSANHFAIMALAVVLAFGAAAVALAPLRVIGWTWWLAAAVFAAVLAWSAVWVMASLGGGRIRSVLSQVWSANRLKKEAAGAVIIASVFALYLFRPIVVWVEDSGDGETCDTSYHIEPPGSCTDQFASRHFRLQIRPGWVEPTPGSVSLLVTAPVGSITLVRAPNGLVINPNQLTQQRMLFTFHSAELTRRRRFEIWVRTDPATTPITAALAFLPGQP